MTAGPRQWLLDANGSGYENPDRRPTREAAKSRLKAAAIQVPAQGDLFTYRA